LSPHDHESKYLPPVPPERIVLVIAKMLSQLSSKAVSSIVLARSSDTA
jgi:hypothetical protein